MAPEARRREVQQLLKDWRAWYSPFGGAASTDAELNLSAKGEYGPGGIIFSGAEFDKEDRKLLRESFTLLRAALLRLRSEDSPAWASLVEPYLADPADPSMVDDWRRRVAELDKENEQRAKATPPKPLRVALVVPRMFLERHDRAVAKLAEYLHDEELHVIFSRPMSEREEKKMEDKNAEMLAVFNRLRASGMKAGAARDQTAESFGVHPDTVDRILEFRADIKPDECVWGGCGRAPYRQNLCAAHYQKKRRLEKKV